MKSTKRKVFASLLTAFTIALAFSMGSGEAFAQSQMDELYVVAAGQFAGTNTYCTYAPYCNTSTCAAKNYNSLDDLANVPTNECSGDLTATRQLGGGSSSRTYTYEGKFHFDGNFTNDAHQRNINETLSFFVLGDPGTSYSISYSGNAAAAARKGAEEAPGCYLGTGPGVFSADVWSPAEVHVRTANAQTNVSDSKRFGDVKTGKTTDPVITVAGKRYSFAFQINVIGHTHTGGYCVKHSEGEESFKISLDVHLTASNHCPIPSGEQSGPGYSWGEGALAPAYIWDVVLEPTTIDFSGRYVREIDYAPGWDGCIAWALTLDPTLPLNPVIGVSNSTPIQVLSGNHLPYGDVVGTTAAKVSLLRHLGLQSACVSTVYQQDEIYCDADGQWHPYRRNILRYSIGPKHVSSERDGHRISKKY